MRTSADESAGEVYARLTLKQKNAIQAVRSARANADRSEAKHAADLAVWQTKVFEAMEQGVPVRLLAESLGLSISRIYQIGDEVAERRQQQG